MKKRQVLYPASSYYYIRYVLLESFLARREILIRTWNSYGNPAHSVNKINWLNIQGKKE